MKYKTSKGNLRVTGLWDICFYSSVGRPPWQPFASAVSLPISSGGKRTGQQVRDPSPGLENYLLKNLGRGYSHTEVPRNKQTRDSLSFLRKLYDRNNRKCSFQKPVPIQTAKQSPGLWMFSGRRGTGEAHQRPSQMFPWRIRTKEEPSRESIQGPWRVVERAFSPEKQNPGQPGGLTGPHLPSYPGQLLVDTDMIPGSTEL